MGIDREAKKRKSQLLSFRRLIYSSFPDFTRMVEDSTINIEDEENLIYNLVDQIYATGTTLDSAINLHIIETSLKLQLKKPTLQLRES